MVSLEEAGDEVDIRVLEVDIQLQMGLMQTSRTPTEHHMDKHLQIRRTQPSPLLLSQMPLLLASARGRTGSSNKLLTLSLHLLSLARGSLLEVSLLPRPTSLRDLRRHL